MKFKVLILFLALTGVVAGCKKDNKGDNAAAANTWQLTPDDNLGVEVYKVKTLVLRTNINQVLEAASEDNPGGGFSGINSSMTLYFPTVGPPPTGTYKVTSVDRLRSADEVAVYVLTYGDTRTGGYLTTWLSPEGSSQTISYKFENGKASAILKNITIQQTGIGPKTATLSANISQ